MARRGRGAQALATAAIGSFVAGTIGTIGLTFVAPLMVEVGAAVRPGRVLRPDGAGLDDRDGRARQLGRARAWPACSSVWRFGLVGIDPQTGQARFAFGVPELLDGIDTVIVAVGLFAVGETLYVASRLRHETDRSARCKGSIWMSREEWSRSWKPWLRGTLLGFPIGALPAGGGEIPTFLSYALEKRLSQEPGGVRPGRDRGRRRSRGGEQCLGGGGAGATAGPRPADVGHGGGHARRLPALRAQSGAAAVRHRPGPRLGTDRQPLHRQRHAADPQPAAGRRLGAPAGHPEALLYAGILVFAGLGAYALNGTRSISWSSDHRQLGFVMRPLDIRSRPWSRGDPGASGRAAFPPFLAIARATTPSSSPTRSRPGCWSPPWCWFWDRVLLRWFRRRSEMRVYLQT